VAEETIITWNPANWITVVLMVALGFTILGMVARIVQQRRAAAA
jgi:hypothetical protein